MGFKGTRPPGQPRTLRSTAEDKGAAPANLVDGSPVPGSGLLEGAVGANEVYTDIADDGSHPSTGARVNSPLPFANFRKGR